MQGESVVNDQDCLWDMVTFIGGLHLTENPQHSSLVNLTEAVARFHLATRQVKIDDDIRQGKAISLQKIQEIFDWWSVMQKSDKEDLSKMHLLNAIEEFMSKGLDFLKETMLRFDWHYSFTKLPRCIVHSDLTKRNIFFENDVVAGIIDFESVRYNSRLLDIVRLAMEFTDPVQDNMNLVLEAYNNVSPLTVYEKENAMLYVGVLNLTVSLWTIKNYISSHLQKYKNHSNFIATLQRAIQIYKVL